MKPVYTEQTIFETNYEIRGVSQTLIMPQYSWNTKSCPFTLSFKLINLTVGWPENLLPEFLKPNLSKALIVLDGKQEKESNKLYKFRLIAISAQNAMTS